MPWSAWLRQVLLVGTGGFLGSVLRFLLVARLSKGAPASFPVGTLTVNVLGCLAIGCLGALADSRAILDPASRRFLVVGILGGFTTFSTFAYDGLALTQAGEAGRALAYVLLSVGLGLAAAWLGYIGLR